MIHEQRGFTSVVVLFICVLTVFVLSVVGILVIISRVQIIPELKVSVVTSEVSSAVSPVVSKNKQIHLYPFFGVNSEININRLNIIGIMFIPKNISTQVKPEWSQNMEKIFQETKIFFEREFEKNINITYQVIPEAYRGEKDIEEYFPSDLAIELNLKKKRLV